MLAALLWTYGLALGSTTATRVASVSLARGEVIVASASGLTALDQRDGRVRWSRVGATLPADSYQGLIVASTRTGIEALDLGGNVLWRRNVCGNHQPPLAVATSGRRAIAACSYSEDGDVLVHVVLLSEGGAVISSRMEGAFLANAPFRTLRINDHVAAFGQVFSGATMQFATTVLDVDTGAEIESDESFSALLSRRETRAARLGIVCRSGGPMADVLWSGTMALAVCGGHGNPLAIDAYRM